MLRIPTPIHCRWSRTSLVAVLIMVGSASPLLAQHFTDVTTSAGITFEHHFDGRFEPQTGHARDLFPGASAADYDDDGWIDLFVPNGHGHANHLYHNNGDGTFSEVGATVGVEMTDDEAVNGLFLDYDNDGDLDLFVGVNGFPSNPLPTETQNRLFRNKGDGTFQDVTVSAKIPKSPYRKSDSQKYSTMGSTGAADFDGDGDLDVYVCYWRDQDQLLRNNGDGTYSNATEDAGLVDLEVDDDWQVIIIDFNGDGLLDLYRLTDFGPNRLHINEGNLTFTEQSAQYGLNLNFSEMGGTLGDYDRDGDFDIYITNIETPIGGTPLATWNWMLRNDTEGPAISYIDQAREKGTEHGAYGWGTTFFDYDNDGWLDIAEVNGRTHQDPRYATDTARIFRNLGFRPGDPNEFEDVSAEVGFEDPRVGRTVIAFDYDRDGDLDLFVTNYNAGDDITLHPEDVAANPGRPVLYRNDGGNEKNWLVVDPIATDGNTRAIGAIIHVTASNGDQMRVITAGTSFLGQEPDEAFFGMSDAGRAESIRVVWPDGMEQTILDQRTNQIITVTRPSTDGEPLAIRIQGPSEVSEAGAHSFTAMADYPGGASIDVTSRATWSIVETVDYAAFLIPGSFIAGDVTENKTVTIRAQLGGQIATIPVTILIPEPSPDDPPQLSLIAPTSESTYATTDEVIEISGIAAGVGLITVAWESNRGPSGTTIGAPDWSTGPVALELGNNNFIFSATAPNGLTVSAALKVTRLRVTIPPDDGSTGEDSGGSGAEGGNGGPIDRRPIGCGTVGMIPMTAFLVGLLWRFSRRRENTRQPT